MKAAHYDLPFYRTKVDTLLFASQEKSTKQEAARELRYAFFEETCKTIGADVVAPADRPDGDPTLLIAVPSSSTTALVGWTRGSTNNDNV